MAIAIIRLLTGPLRLIGQMYPGLAITRAVSGGSGGEASVGRHNSRNSVFQKEPVHIYLSRLPLEDRDEQSSGPRSETGDEVLCTHQVGSKSSSQKVCSQQNYSTVKLDRWTVKDARSAPLSSALLSGPLLVAAAGN